MPPRAHTPNPYDVAQPSTPGIKPIPDGAPLEPTGFDRDQVRVVEDRPCRGCGYNLKGLPVGARCPECARPITRRQPLARPDTILDAPAAYIRLMQAGFWLLSIAACGVVATYVMMQAGLSETVLVTFATIGVWVTGVVVISVPRPHARPDVEKRKGDWPVPRVLTVASQCCWLAMPAAWLFAPAAAGAAPPLYVTIAATVALAGLVPTTWLIANLSEWGGDEVRAFRLKLAAGWGGAFALLSLMGVSFRVAIPLPTVGAFLKGVDLIAFAVLWSLGYLVWSLWNIAGMMTWAGVNAAERRDRERRLREKVDAESASHRAELQRRQPFGGPLR